MQGFNRNVTSSFGGVDTQEREVLQYAHLGSEVANVYNKVQEEKTKNRKNYLLGETQKLVQVRDESLSQNPTQAKRLNLKLQRSLMSLGNNAQEREFVLRNASQIQGSNVSAELRQSIAEESETVDRRAQQALNDPMGIALASKSVQLGTASKEELEEFVLEYNQAILKQESARLSQQKMNTLAGKNDKQARQNWSDWAGQTSSMISTLTANMRSTAASIRELPDAERSAQYTQLKNDTISAIEVYREQLFNTSSQIRPKMTADEAKEFDKEVKTFMENADRTIAGLEKWEDNQIDQLSQYLDITKKEIGMDAINSATRLFGMREAFGDQAVNSVMNAVIQKDPQILNMLSGQISSEILSAGGLTQGQKAAMNMRIATSMFEGKSILDLDPEQREAAAQKHWTLSGKLIKDGSILSSSSEARSSAANNLAIVLDMAQESADIGQMKRATELLNHPNFKQYYSSLDKTDKKIVGQFVVTFNQDVMQDRNLGLVRKMGAYEQISYNATKGKYEYKPKAVPQDALKQSSLLGGSNNAVIATQRTNKEAEALVNEANTALDKMVEYKQEDAFLAGKSKKEIADYVYQTTLIKGGGRLSTQVPVKGTLTIFDETDIEAQESGLNKEEYLRLIDEENQMQRLMDVSRGTLQKLSLNVQDPDVVKQAAGKLDSLTKDKSSLDTSDMDDDEKRELIKLLQAELNAKTK